MPILKKFLRQRERSLERTWTPFSANVLVYNISGTIYTRTYPKLVIDYNDVLDNNDPIPVGFKFNPIPDPPLVPITPEITFNTVPAQNLFALDQVPPPAILLVQGSQNAPIGQPIPTTIPIPQLLNEGIIDILVGTGSKPAYATSFLARHILIIADKNNTGTVYVSTALNTPAGAGVPLDAGMFDEMGDPTLEVRKVDLSTIFLIGTNVNDKVHLQVEA